MSADVEVRDVRGVEEMRACQALQRRAWGITEDGYTVPVATLVSVQKMGGLVQGAFLRGRLVGFTFAFLGRIHGELVLYSQLTAVEPDLQGSGVGRLLKLEQRRRAHEVGVGKVVWAFDPLQAGNAFFNLAVLGAHCCVYEVNLYGSRTDELNVGLATDRLLAEWPTSGPVGGLAGRWSDGRELVESHPDDATGLRRAIAVRPIPEGGARLHVEVPARIGVVKAHAALASEWQACVRQAFQAAFAAGYIAVGFARGDQPCYLLEARR